MNTKRRKVKPGDIVEIVSDKKNGLLEVGDVVKVSHAAHIDISDGWIEVICPNNYNWNIYPEDWKFTRKTKLTIR